KVFYSKIRLLVDENILMSLGFCILFWVNKNDYCFNLSVNSSFPYILNEYHYNNKLVPSF
ncbi:MAG: hypothetical protein J6574_09990, partial [Gilliamella sp.]|nr:hypothetical protein [Gilliamella sp.]